MKRSTASRAMLAAVLIGAIFSLTGCAGLGQILGTEFRAEPSRALTTKPCPPLRHYSEREMQRAGREMDTLGPGTALWSMMDDYLYMRDACR